MSDRGRELSLREAAERLGVHYMTAYRYVRTGQLPGRRVHGEWRIARRDLDAFTRSSTTTRRAKRGAPRWTEHARRLRARLVGGDEPGAWQVLERALVNGAEPPDLYVRVLAPALREVGDAWAEGRLSIEDEHRASAVATRVVGRLGPQFARTGRRRGTVLLGAAPGDTHSLPAALLADVLRGERYEVVELGASTPVESFVSAATTIDSVVAIGISASTDDARARAADVIRALRRASVDVPVLLGGPAVTDGETARRAGADGWAPDALSAAARVDELVR
jgi:excisionase family DNA binding protein